MGGLLRAKRPLEESGCQFGPIGRGGPPPESCGYKGGSWFLANKPWIPSPPSPMHTSCLFSFYTVVGSGGGPVEMRLFEEDGLSCYLFGGMAQS